MHHRGVIFIIIILGFTLSLGGVGADDKGGRGGSGFHRSKPKPLTEEQIKKALEEPQGKTPHKLPGRAAAKEAATVKLCLQCHQAAPEAPQELQIKEKEPGAPNQ